MAITTGVAVVIIILASTAAIIVAVVQAVAAYRRPVPTLPKKEAREAAYHRMMSDIVFTETPRADIALLMLEEARNRYQRAQAGGDNIEAKATTFLTIVAGATGALGVFGISKEGKLITPTPIILFAIIFALVGMGCLLYVLRPKSVDDPDVAAHISAAVAGESTAGDDHRARLAIVLSESYTRDSYRYVHQLRADPSLMFAAYVAVATAAILVLANAAASSGGNATSAASPSPQPSATGTVKSHNAPAGKGASAARRSTLPTSPSRTP